MTTILMPVLGEALPFAALLAACGLLAGPCDRWITRAVSRLGKPVKW